MQESGCCSGCRGSQRREWWRQDEDSHAGPEAGRHTPPLPSEGALPPPGDSPIAYLLAGPVIRGSWPHGPYPVFWEVARLLALSVHAWPEASLSSLDQCVHAWPEASLSTAEAEETAGALVPSLSSLLPSAPGRLWGPSVGGYDLDPRATGPGDKQLRAQALAREAPKTCTALTAQGQARGLWRLPSATTTQSHQGLEIHA